MTGIHDFPLFLLSALMLNLTPGADSLYVISHTGTQGLRAGLVAALGISAGCVIHVLAAVFGLSAILASSATLFEAVKVAGAAYLIYMGFCLLRHTRSLSSSNNPAKKTLQHIFRQAVLTNTLNPKVALFFLAFLPQFVHPEATGRTWSLLLLGLTFITTGTLWCCLLAVVTSQARKLTAPPFLLRWINRGIGALFILLGLKLAASQSN